MLQQAGAWALHQLLQPGQDALACTPYYTEPPPANAPGRAGPQQLRVAAGQEALIARHGLKPRRLLLSLARRVLPWGELGPQLGAVLPRELPLCMVEVRGGSGAGSRGGDDATAAAELVASEVRQRSLVACAWASLGKALAMPLQAHARAPSTLCLAGLLLPTPTPTPSPFWPRPQRIPANTVLGPLAGRVVTAERHTQLLRGGGEAAGYAGPLGWQARSVCWQLLALSRSLRLPLHAPTGCTDPGVSAAAAEQQGQHAAVLLLGEGGPSGSGDGSGAQAAALAALLAGVVRDDVRLGDRCSDDAFDIALAATLGLPESHARERRAGASSSGGGQEEHAAACGADECASGNCEVRVSQSCCLRVRERGCAAGRACREGGPGSSTAPAGWLCGCSTFKHLLPTSAPSLPIFSPRTTRHALRACPPSQMGRSKRERRLGVLLRMLSGTLPSLVTHRLLPAHHSSAETPNPEPRKPSRSCCLTYGV